MDSPNPPHPGRPAYAGQPFPHDSGLIHATGEARFIDDMPEPPGLLHGALRLSEVAHGLIRTIRVAPALESDGVTAVLTADDIPGKNEIGPIVVEEPAIAESRVEYIGEPVALVLADRLERAKAGARLVRPEIEPLPAILDPLEAHRRKLYVSDPQVLQRGRSRERLAASEHRLEGSLRLGGQDHFYLETQTALALPEDDGSMTVWLSTQHPSEAQARIARLLGWSSNRVEVRVRRLGGGFGGKESQSTIVGALAALGAYHTQRPVKLRLDRHTDMLMTGKRHDFHVYWSAGFDSRGRIEALEMDLLSRCGPVADLSPAVMTRAIVLGDNCYAIPHVTYRGYCCRTNTVSNTAFRGFGGPQGVTAIESVVDDVARRLGRPPESVREINFYGKTNGIESPCGQPLRPCRVADVVSGALARSDFATRRKEIDDWNRESPAVRRGLAMAPVKFGIAFNIPAMNQGGAVVHVYRDGSIRLNHGGTEMGQGLFVKVAQVVAEVFQVPLSQIQCTSTSTGEVPNTAATAASTGSDINAMAALKAAQKIRKRMTGVAQELFGEGRSDILFRDGRVLAGNRSMSLGELAEACWQRRVSLSATGYYRTPGLSWDPKRMRGNPSHYYTWGACVAEVAVDLLTGESRTLRADLVQDCGTSLNPTVDLGQIEGAFVQGMGWLTSEELFWKEDGTLATTGPSTYKIPGSRDTPPVFNVYFLDNAPNEADTPFRSKATGEPPLLLAVSVWLAIRDAIASTQPAGQTVPLNAPATPEQIRLAVEALRQRARSADRPEAADLPAPVA